MDCIYIAPLSKALYNVCLSFTHSHTFTHQQRLVAMQGTDQLVRGNWGLGVLLRDTSTRPGWDRTGNPPTARRQLLPPEPYRCLTSQTVNVSSLQAAQLPVERLWLIFLSGVNRWRWCSMRSCWAHALGVRVGWGLPVPTSLRLPAHSVFLSKPAPPQCHVHISWLVSLVTYLSW